MRVHAHQQHSPERLGTPKSHHADSAHQWFALDQRLVLNQLDVMKTTARSSADELSMIAAEGIFGRKLCKKFLAVAGQYLQIVRGLVNLRGAAARPKRYPRQEEPIS